MLHGGATHSPDLVHSSVLRQPCVCAPNTPKGPARYARTNVQQPRAAAATTLTHMRAVLLTNTSLVDSLPAPILGHSKPRLPNSNALLPAKNTLRGLHPDSSLGLTACCT